MAIEKCLLEKTEEFRRLGIAEQNEYSKRYLYSLITNSTAIEGSTVTEVENQLLFDEGISAKKRSIYEQMMNLDLRYAYLLSAEFATEHRPYTSDMLRQLSAAVMKNTGSFYNTLQGSFDSSKGDFRLVNVSAGAAGKSYKSYTKIAHLLEDWCLKVNNERKRLAGTNNYYQQYLFSFEAHMDLLTIHPWVDGNGRTARLVMNQLQQEFKLLPVKILKEDKAAYVQALIDAREKEDKNIFTTFMMQNHIKNLQDEVERFKQST